MDSSRGVDRRADGDNDILERLRTEAVCGRLKVIGGRRRAAGEDGTGVIGGNGAECVSM